MQKRRSSGSSHKENDCSASGKTTAKMKKKKKDGEPKKEKKVNGPRGQSQSCHQCRQSIFSSKGAVEVRQGQLRVKCSSCTRYWCEKCLKNRYGVTMESLDREQWSCPVCSGNCNCSLCRRKEGKLATGILTPLAKNAGFSSVSDFLSKGTDDIAKCLQWKAPDAAKTNGTPSRKRINEARKRTRRDSCERDSPSDALNDAKENSCTLDKKSLAKTTPSPKRQDSDVTKVCTRTIPPDSAPKRPRITHPSYCITVIGCRDDVNDPDWAGNGRAMHKEQNGWDDASLCGTRNAPQRVLRSRVVPQRTAAISRIRREKLTKRETLRNRRLSVQGKNSGNKKTSPVMMTMRHELEQLKCARVAERKEAEKSRRRAAREERLARQRASRQKRRLLKLEQAENRKRLRAAREKLLKAKLLLRDAKKSQRAAEKERKKRELAELVARKKEERRRVCQLPSALMLVKDDLEKELMEDDPNDCRLLGVPDLPPLPCLESRVSNSQLSSFLFVCEFLRLFASTLNIKHCINSSSLLDLLDHPRIFVSICWSLLKAVSEGDVELSSEMKAASSPRQWEEVLHTFLNRGRKNGSVLNRGATVSERLVILELLCDLALSSEPVISSIEAACKEGEELNRQARRETRSILDEMKSDLKRLCEAHASLEEMEHVRDCYKKKLEVLCVQNEKTVEFGRLRTRLRPLGEDRYGRLFWKLESHPGLVLVEPSSRCHGDGEGEWAVIDSLDLHQKFTACLFASGRREALLLNNLRKVIFPPDDQ